MLHSFVCVQLLLGSFAHDGFLLAKLVLKSKITNRKTSLISTPQQYTVLKPTPFIYQYSYTSKVSVVHLHHTMPSVHVSIRTYDARALTLHELECSELVHVLPTASDPRLCASHEGEIRVTCAPQCRPTGSHIVLTQPTVRENSPVTGYTHASYCLSSSKNLVPKPHWPGTIKRLQDLHYRCVMYMIITIMVTLWKIHTAYRCAMNGLACTNLRPHAWDTSPSSTYPHIR